MKSRSEFRLFGIFGFPLAHTLSPGMQEAAFAHQGIKAFYLVFQLKPHAFQKAMEDLSPDLLDGFNVTIPYKEKVTDYVDALTEDARVLGAVNTVFRKGGRWIGANTDHVGFLKALSVEARFSPRGKRALVLGAGGSARAVVYAIAKSGGTVIQIVNRHRARAQKLANDFKRRFPQVKFETSSLDIETLKEAVREADLVVNATSVGLRPKDSSLVPASVIPAAKTGERKCFFDLIYRPAETDFLRLARRRGHTAVGGLGMLLYQGASAFELWTGRKPPVAVMRRTLERALKESKE